MSRPKILNTLANRFFGLSVASLVLRGVIGNRQTKVAVFLLRRLKTLIYFIQNKETKNIKIGYSVNTLNRLSSGQSFSAEDLILLVEIEGVTKDEKALHKRFSHLRIKREWFKPGQDLLEYIDEINNEWVIFAEAQLEKLAPEILEESLPQNNVSKKSLQKGKALYQKLMSQTTEDEILFRLTHIDDGIWHLADEINKGFFYIGETIKSIDTNIDIFERKYSEVHNTRPNKKYGFFHLIIGIADFIALRLAYLLVSPFPSPPVYPTGINGNIFPLMDLNNNDLNKIVNYIQELMSMEKQVIRSWLRDKLYEEPFHIDLELGCENSMLRLTCAYISGVEKDIESLVLEAEDEDKEKPFSELYELSFFAWIEDTKKALGYEEPFDFPELEDWEAIVVKGDNNDTDT